MDAVLVARYVEYELRELARAVSVEAGIQVELERGRSSPGYERMVESVVFDGLVEELRGVVAALPSFGEWAANEEALRAEDLDRDRRAA